MGYKSIFITNPSKLSYKNGFLCVRQESGLQQFHLDDVNSIIIDSLQVNFTAYLLCEITKRKVSVVICDEAHNPLGQFLPLHGAHNCTKKINEQLEWSVPLKKRVWQTIVKHKIYHQANVLEYSGFDEHKALLSMMRETKSGDVTMQEATAARKYFSCLFGSNFTRDDDVPVNACLNYGYAILLSTVNKEISARGHLTQVGINHKNEYNEFNLACDFMEPFRPFVDRLVLDNIMDGLDSQMKKVLCNFTNNRVFYDDGIYKLGSVISLFVQDCFRALNREIEPSDIMTYEFL